MKTYPSIVNSNALPRSFVPHDMYVFAKLDGSNLRFEWSKKSGWYKYGTRTRLFDHTDEIFGPAINIFQDTLACPLDEIFKNQRYESAVVFAEFYGKNSFAGLHDPTENKFLSLIDVAPYKKGILGPKEFVDLFGHLNIAKFLGVYFWDQDFIQEVRQGKFLDDAFEGVVGKSGKDHKLFMAKAKTQAWVDKVKERYGDKADGIINS